MAHESININLDMMMFEDIFTFEMINGIYDPPSPITTYKSGSSVKEKIYDRMVRSDFFVPSFPTIRTGVIWESYHLYQKIKKIFGH